MTEESPVWTNVHVGRVMRLMVLAFFFWFLNWLVSGDIYLFSVVDIFLLFIIPIGGFFWLSMTMYFYYHSPHIWMETDKVSTSDNEFYQVVPDDARLPPMLLLPYGGYKTQMVYMGGDDMGSHGGTIFAPHYMVERLGQHLIVHGKPLRLSTDAVESNTWMWAALDEFDNYVHGKTAVYICLWGEGPPTDQSHDKRERFNEGEVRKELSDFARELSGLAISSEDILMRRLRMFEETRKKPDAEKLLMEQVLAKQRKAEGKSDEQR